MLLEKDLNYRPATAQVNHYALDNAMCEAMFLRQVMLQKAT